MGRKRILGIVLGLLLIGNFAFAKDSNFKPGSEPDGFRGIKWGQDISTVPGLKYLETDKASGGVQRYARERDELRVGGAELETINYDFWRGKFSGVWIDTKGSANSYGLEDAVFEKFGKGYQSNEYIEKYSWFGETTRMMLEYNEISENGRLYMWAKVINDQREAYDKQKAKEGAERGF